MNMGIKNKCYVLFLESNLVFGDWTIYKICATKEIAEKEKEKYLEKETKEVVITKYDFIST